jgi:hypothetical protein
VSEDRSLKRCFAYSPESSWRLSGPSLSSYAPLSLSPDEEGIPLPKRRLFAPWVATVNSGSLIENPFTDHVGKIEMRTGLIDVAMTNSQQASLPEDDITSLGFLGKENHLPIRKRRVIEREPPMLPQPISEFNKVESTVT